MFALIDLPYAHNKKPLPVRVTVKADYKDGAMGEPAVQTNIGGLFEVEFTLSQPLPHRN